MPSLSSGFSAHFDKQTLGPQACRIWAARAKSALGETAECFIKSTTLLLLRSRRFLRRQVPDDC